MGGFIAAWLVGEGIIIYRSVKNQKAPPGPGQLLFSSGVFVMLALLAEAPSARTLALTLAWGFDIAALMNLWSSAGSIVGGQAGNAIGSLSGAKPGTVGKWPPSMTPNTQILPTADAKVA